VEIKHPRKFETMIGDIAQIIIGNRVFAVRQGLAEEMIKLLEDGKRFWEWEKEIVVLTEIKDVLLRKIDAYKLLYGSKEGAK
jgi:hypothetical protein